MVEPCNTSPQLTGDEKQLRQLKVYTSPRVEKLGDLRSLTLGTSPGLGESIGAGTFYAFGYPQDFGG
jgi:hypothetical protein